MFRFSERLSSSGGAGSRLYLKRAALFAGGLVLLWIALQLFPNTAAEPPVYSDEAGSVASSPQVRSTYQGPDLFTFGNMAALIILVGGGAFAYVMHKRSGQSSGGTSLIESMGELAIGQGQQLRLVRCGGEVLLIGATAQEITLLRDFDPALFDPSDQDADAVSEDDHAYERQRVNPSTGQPVNTTRQPVNTHFADVLRQYAGRYVNIQSNGRPC